MAYNNRGEFDVCPDGSYSDTAGSNSCKPCPRELILILWQLILHEFARNVRMGILTIKRDSLDAWNARFLKNALEITRKRRLLHMFLNSLSFMKKIIIP